MRLLPPGPPLSPSNPPGCFGVFPRGERPTRTSRTHPYNTEPGQRSEGDLNRTSSRVEVPVADGQAPAPLNPRRTPGCFGVFPGDEAPLLEPTGRQRPETSPGDMTGRSAPGPPQEAPRSRSRSPPCLRSPCLGASPALSPCSPLWPPPCLPPSQGTLSPLAPSTSPPPPPPFLPSISPGHSIASVLAESLAIGTDCPRSLSASASLSLRLRQPTQPAPPTFRANCSDTSRGSRHARPVRAATSSALEPPPGTPSRSFDPATTPSTLPQRFSAH